MYTGRPVISGVCDAREDKATGVHVDWDTGSKVHGWRDAAGLTWFCRHKSEAKEGHFRGSRWGNLDTCIHGDRWTLGGALGADIPVPMGV
jgi:hypothetical protein